MQSIMKMIKLASLLFVSAILISCGGGGGSSSSSGTSSSSVSGTAAVGAPILGGTVNIYDSTGTLVGTTTTSTTDGSYTVPSVSGKAPYTVEVIGNVGDSQGKYYAVVGSTGVANVNQISNGIAASLSSTGDPSALTAGHSQTAANISTKETGFVGALNTLLTALGVSGSPVTGSFSAALDSALDNINVVVLPDGSYEIASSEGQAMPDIMGSFNPDATQAASHKVQSYAKGTTPSSSEAAYIPAPSSSIAANAATLETLRSQLETCFSHAAASRGVATSSGVNPSWGSTIHADCKNLAYDDGAGSGFKHDSYYWIDGDSSNSTSIKSGCTNTNGYCLGFFGVMLTNSNYDKLTVLKPDRIRPVGTNLWHVRFPVVYASGSRGSFGDMVGSTYNVVRYDTSTKKFQFYGNQRDVQSTIQPAVSLIEKGATGKYRLETGLNIYVNPYNSRSLKNKNCTGGAAACVVYPISARITPMTSSGLLPTGGVMMGNKVNTPPSITTGVGSSKNSPFNVCTYMNFEDPTLISANYSVAITGDPAAACSGVIRLNYGEYTKDSKGALVAASGIYPPPRARPSWVSSWNADGTYNGNDSRPLVTATTAKRGEPYKFVITMSNGDVIKLVNRLPYSSLSPDQAANLPFPRLASGVDTSFASFAGSSNGFNLSWSQQDTALIFAAAIYWEQGDVDNTLNLAPGATSATVPCPSNTYNALAGKNYAGDVVDDLLSCTKPLNWRSSTASAPDGGVLQLKAKTPDGLFIQSQVKQF